MFYTSSKKDKGKKVVKEKKADARNSKVFRMVVLILIILRMSVLMMGAEMGISTDIAEEVCLPRTLGPLDTGYGSPH